jgi:long-chain fatty acid transport protein
VRSLGDLRQSLVAVALLLAAQPAPAQTNAEVNAGIQFNFSTPGARSLGLGGAFLGLADDATAAYANPAGLTVLSRPEISLEGRNWSYTQVFTDRGRLTGEPTQRGVDTLSRLHEGEHESSERGLSFVSLVYPTNRWAFALYRHELADFAGSFQSQGAFSSTNNRVSPTQNSISLKIENLGFAVSYRIQRLSLGAGLSRYDFSLDARTRRYQLSLPTSNTEPGGYAGPPLYVSDNLLDMQFQKGEDHDLGVNAGFQLVVGERWRVGGVYRQGPDFDFQAIYRPEKGELPDLSDIAREARFATPDVLGLGVAYQPTDFSTIALDYIHVEYSDLTQHFTHNFSGELPPDERAQFRIDDAREIHLGCERIFSVGKTLFAARIGAWRDPDHRIHYGGETSYYQTLFRSGDDETHYAAGIGYLDQRFQVDAAFDFSDRVRTASLSTVIRF